MFERDPVGIPQLFDDGPPPWFRRRWGIAIGVTGLLCLSGLALSLQQYGLSGTAQRARHAGASVLRAFARAVG